MRRLLERPGKAETDALRNEMRTLMMKNVGIYRTAEMMENALVRINAMRQELAQIGVGDKNAAYNTALLEALELQNLMDLSAVTATSALGRRESRGAHARRDYPDRDDKHFLNHTFCYLDGDTTRFEQKPVDLSVWEPKARKY